MHHFAYRKNQLHAEELSVDKLAEKFGTPLYVYSEQTIRDHWTRLKESLGWLDHQICYAVKANSNLSIIKLLAKLGASFDIVSAGELYRVIQAKGDPKKCTFAGVGKTQDEIAYALKSGIYAFTVESEDELAMISKVAQKMKKRAPVAFRVNPNVDAGSHHKITTGTYENKFGIPFEQILPLYQKASKNKNIWLRGVHMHIGSQITNAGPFTQALQRMVPLVRTLKEEFDIEFFNVGGGLGIVYDNALESGEPKWWQREERPMNFTQYSQIVKTQVADLGLKILLEPGRAIVGNAGILVSEVLYVKKTGKKRFVIVDAAMNDLVRPAMYDAFHEIVPLEQPLFSRTTLTDVVGPVCESGDYFAQDRALPEFTPGERLAIMSTGAYGFTMSSNYNSRPRPAEVLVSGKKATVVRKRERMEDLVRGE